MAIVTQQYTLAANTRTAINISDTPEHSGYSVMLYGETNGSQTIAVGNSTVTLANGIHLYKQEKMTFNDMRHGDQLYVIADAICDLRVIAWRVD